MRLGELIQIKWERGPEDIGTGHARNYVYLDREEKTLTIKFKRKLRVIPASHVWGVFETLRKRRKEDRAYVFASPNGGHYDDSYVCRLWKKETEKAKQEGVLGRAYTCHSIRHAVVTSLLRKDYSAHKVGQLVGHSSEQITERYAHLVASDLNGMVVDLSD
jgi:integrase